jgi:hypothetical protein
MPKTFVAVTFVVFLVGGNISQLQADEEATPPAQQPAACCGGEPCCAPAPRGCRHGFLGRLRDRFRRPNCCSADSACQPSSCEQCGCQPQCRRSLWEKLHLRRPTPCVGSQEAWVTNAPAQEPPQSPGTPDGVEKEPEAPRTQSAKPTRAWIKAVPNPVSIRSDRGMITLSWNTGDGIGQVYVSQNGGEEQLVREGAEGSGDINWIQPGSVYDFTLYAGREHKQRLAIVTVRAVRSEK